MCVPLRASKPGQKVNTTNQVSNQDCLYFKFSQSSNDPIYIKENIPKTNYRHTMG